MSHHRQIKFYLHQQKSHIFHPYRIQHPLSQYLYIVFQQDHANDVRCSLNGNIWVKTPHKRYGVTVFENMTSLVGIVCGMRTNIEIDVGGAAVVNDTYTVCVCTCVCLWVTDQSWVLTLTSYLCVPCPHALCVCVYSVPVTDACKRTHHFALLLSVSVCVRPGTSHSMWPAPSVRGSLHPLITHISPTEPCEAGDPPLLSLDSQLRNLYLCLKTNWSWFNKLDLCITKHTTIERRRDNKRGAEKAVAFLLSSTSAGFPVSHPSFANPHP